MQVAERILLSATLPVVSTRSEVSPNGKKNATLTTALEMILNASESNEASQDLRVVEKQRVKPGLTPGDEGATTSTALQEEMVDEARSKSENPLATITGLVEKAVGQQFHEALLCA